MKLTSKKLDEIKRGKYYVHISYTSRYSIGTLIIKGLFLIEKYKKITKLFKDCEVKTILIRDEMTGIAITYLKDLNDTKSWLLGKE